MNGRSDFENAYFESDSELDGESSQDEQEYGDLEADQESAARYGCPWCGKSTHDSSLELDEAEQLAFDANETGVYDPSRAPGWPSRSRFKGPAGGTIPSGPYKTSPLPCQAPYLDFHALRRLLQSFNQRILLLRALQKKTPRDQAKLDELTKTAKREFTTLQNMLKAMRQRVQSGAYLRQGCTPKDIAKVTCLVKQLQGFWRKSRTLERLRDQLVFTLSNGRGRFASASCSSLGVK
jgi:hypothetical protein